MAGFSFNGDNRSTTKVQQISFFVMWQQYGNLRRLQRAEDMIIHWKTGQVHTSLGHHTTKWVQELYIPSMKICFWGFFVFDISKGNFLLPGENGNCQRLSEKNRRIYVSGLTENLSDGVSRHRKQSKDSPKFVQQR